MFGLDVDTLGKIRNCLAQFPDIEKVLIYGSRATGNYKRGSDIDITLLGEKITRENSLSPLRDSLDDLNLPYEFDISIFNQLSGDDFIDRVKKEGQVFYQRPINAE